MIIKLSKPAIGSEEKAAVMEVLNQEFLGMGSEVQLFERELQVFLDSKKDVVCVGTGTAALHLALQAAGVGCGDEVLVPSLTFVASYQAISATGATPVSCDVRPDTLFLDINDAAKRLSSRTKAVMPVHYASDSQFMDGVYEFARASGLRVIEDAAHSFGSKRNGRCIGADGDIICFSFDGIKNITSGEGGAILCDDLAVVQRVRDARLLGIKNDTEKRFANTRSWEFDVENQGYRYHMSNIMAAIGRAQLRKIHNFKSARQTLARTYIEAIGRLNNVTTLALDWDNIMPFMFVIQVIGGHRNRLRQTFLDNGIECGIHYLPNHLLCKYRTSYSLPVAEEKYREILTLPLHVDLSYDQQNKIIDILRRAE